MDDDENPTKPESTSPLTEDQSDDDHEECDTLLKDFLSEGRITILRSVINNRRLVLVYAHRCDSCVVKTSQYT